MDLSDPTTVTVVVVVAVVVLALLVAGLLAARRRRHRAEEQTARREHLQERFGPEYERAVSGAPDVREAEDELAQVEERRAELDIRPLEEGSRARWAERWQGVQTAFVEVPVEAVDSAGRLVGEVMSERGYPSADDDERMRLLATDHADVVEHYRTAQSYRARFHSGEGSTEDLRRAFVQYRRLFDALVADRPVADDDTADPTADRTAGDAAGDRG